MEATEVQVNTPTSIEMANSLAHVQETRISEKEQKTVRAQESGERPQKISEEIIDEERVAHEIADAMNQVVSALNTHLSFRVHESTGKMIVQVIDSETGEVRRQIPPEEMVRLLDKMRTVVGMLFNEEA